MKNFLYALLFSAVSVVAAAQAAQAQTVPQPPNFEQTPPQIPLNTPLSSPEVERILIGTFGFSPVVAANIVLRSEATYGFYYTVDQALALAPTEGEE